MSLTDSAKKSHLEDEYQQYRNRADRAKRDNHPKKAARYYRQCVGVLKELAAVESNTRLQTERLELAQNLSAAADQLEAGIQSNDSTGSSAVNSSSEKSSTTSSPQTGEQSDSAEADTDPQTFLSDPPEQTFSDVGGMTDLKETLKDQVIDPLKRPELYEEYDLGVVNGVLLHGPPGKGKTYITEALAGELGYNFVEAQASDVTSSLVGEAADNMAELFSVARNNQPCLLFLDEIDALASSRDGGADKTISERQMITQFLTEMSETKGEDVVVVGATNLPDEIDGAAWRRFDERIEVPPPDPTARAAIMRIHLRDRPVLTEEIDWETIKAATEGYSSSDLEIISSKAARAALKEARTDDDIVPISQSHIEAAIEETTSSLEEWD
jgi:transitional endoplasmic reticulum ATPase